MHRRRQEFAGPAVYLGNTPGNDTTEKYDPLAVRGLSSNIRTPGRYGSASCRRQFASPCHTSRTKKNKFRVLSPTVRNYIAGPGARSILRLHIRVYTTTCLPTWIAQLPAILRFTSADVVTSLKCRPPFRNGRGVDRAPARLSKPRYILSRRRALPLQIFSLSSRDKGNVSIHCVPGGFSTNG